MDSGGRQSGFTLIELMVTIAVVAIAITLSTPFSNVYKQNRVTTQVHEFVAALNLARSEAITRGNSVSICISGLTDPSKCSTDTVNQNDPPLSWENGWLVFSDANGNCTIDGTDLVLHHHKQLANKFSLQQTNSTCIQYNSNGVAPTTNGVWTLCDPSASDTYKRGVFVSISGRVQILDVNSATTEGVTLDNCPVT